MSAVNLFVAMVGLHALADYPLQGDFLASGKNRATPIPGVPWYQPLAAHAIIHGLMVFIIAVMVAPHLALVLFVAETLAHGAIDDAKCTGKFDGRCGPGARSFNIDQALHIACKALWVAIIFA
jgi:hypothetical protein